MPARERGGVLAHPEVRVPEAARMDEFAPILPVRRRGPVPRGLELAEGVRAESRAGETEAVAVSEAGCGAGQRGGLTAAGERILGRFGVGLGTLAQEFLVDAERRGLELFEAGDKRGRGRVGLWGGV